MASGSDREPRETGLEGDTRWSAVLRQVYEASQSDARWYQKVGIFVAWSIGIALAVGIATILILAVVDLFSRQRLLNPGTMSDWLFWSSALVLFGGLLAPSASDLEESARDKRRGSGSQPSVTQKASTARPPSEAKRSLLDRLDDRRERAVRKRMMRVYNPWRWRLWASAAFCFCLSMLAGLFA